MPADTRTARTRARRSDAVQSQAAAMRSVTSTIAPPAVLKLRTKFELTIWDHLMKSRRKSRWTQAHLLEAGQYVKNAVLLNRMEATVRKQGETVISASGAINAHPLLSRIATLQTQQLKILRAVGVAVSLTHEKPDKHFFNEQDARASLARVQGGENSELLSGGTNADLLPGGPLSFLASPLN